LSASPPFLKTIPIFLLATSGFVATIPGGFNARLILHIKVYFRRNLHFQYLNRIFIRLRCLRKCDVIRFKFETLFLLYFSSQQEGKLVQLTDFAQFSSFVHWLFLA